MLNKHFITSVQLKRCAIKIKIRSTNNRSNIKYTSQVIDIVAVYERTQKACYAINMSEIEGMSEVTLRTKPYPGVSCRDAKLYLLS